MSSGCPDDKSLQEIAATGPHRVCCGSSDCVSLHRSEDEVVAAPIKYILVKKELDFLRLQVRFLVELVHLAT